jgi:D-inositol-3-phosphate glycosyltransferase
MVGLIKRVAMVSMQGSPRAEPGEADASDVTILALAAEFAIRDVEVDVVTRAIGDPSVSQLFPGVTLHEIRAGDIGPMSEQRLPAVTDEFGERVAELARSTSQRHDIIHAHYWLSGIATLPVAVELGIPLVQSFHTLGVMKNAALGDRPGHEAPAVRLRGETFLAHQADALIAASSAEATALIDDVRAPADRTWIVRPGVDLELFSLHP